MSAFAYDVFLCHAWKDKPIAQAIAERLRADSLKVWFDDWEIKPGDSIPARIEDGLQRSAVLVLCMSANAFGSDWAALESQTFRFRDPLNKDRRFIPLRLDHAEPPGSLSQFKYIDWRGTDHDRAYAMLRDACARLPEPPTRPKEPVREGPNTRVVSLEDAAGGLSFAVSPDESRTLVGSMDGKVRLCDLETGRCLRVMEGHSDWVRGVSFSGDGRRALSGSDDITLRLWDVKSGRCLRVLKGHSGYVFCVCFSRDGRRALSGSYDNTVRLWDVESGRCLRVLKGHSDVVWTVCFSGDGQHALSGSEDKTARLWDVDSGRCLRVLEGHSAIVRSVCFSDDGRRALSGSSDKTVRLWDVDSGRCLRVLEGHGEVVRSVSFSGDGRRALSGSDDQRVRLWDVESGRCLRVLEGHSNWIWSVSFSGDGRSARSADLSGILREWDISHVAGVPESTVKFVPQLVAAIPEQVEYTNAKVLLVGDTSSGKTGLAHRLATGQWKPTDGSTVGAWCTQWALSASSGPANLDREIWLWDFGGQADQRLVNLLYMDRAALILLLFDADKGDVLPGLRDWQTALRRCVPSGTPQLLVAGRTDTGFKASRAKLQAFAQENRIGYFETSAKEGDGCDALTQAIKGGIRWDQIETRTSPRIFKLIKDQILKLRDQGQVLHTFKELRDELSRRLPEEPRFSDETLQAVISLLDGPGVVQELDYGTYVLLQPEWINAYAQAVIRTLRQDPSELGRLPLRSIAEGRLLFQSVTGDGGVVEMKRLPESQERVVLREMERQLEERSLCFRQGDKLVFPSHCGRDRPAVLEHPSVFVSYRVQGYLDEIYATLAVKLADSNAFKLSQLWRDAADFQTLRGEHHMGIKLTREAADVGDISVYFGRGVTAQEQVIFANYIHAHLAARCEDVQRRRYYVCPHCNTPKGNPDVLMRKLLDKRTEATVECDECEKRFSLWDDLEQLFASDEIRAKVEGLQAVDAVRLDSRRKGKLLALEVGARITSADQKCFEIPAPEDEGIDMELEFTDDNGKGTGKRLYLQLKSGNAHLEKRKDGTEVFQIKKQDWVQYWLKQPDPVMLVIGTFAEDEERRLGKDKLEFADVRWMEISTVLKHASEDGKKPVTQIEFKAERLDLTSVRRWRDKQLGRA